jgi:hypothetical protein
LNNDVNGTFNTFFCIFLNIFQASFPVKYKNCNINKGDWITKGIKVSCKHKRSLYILNRSCDDPRIKTYYKRYCVVLKKVIKEAKESVTGSISKQSENDLEYNKK